MDAERLKKITLFSELDERSLRLAAARAEVLSVPAGQVIMRESDFSYDVLGILEGQVEITYGGRTIALLGPGELVGEIGCLSKGPRSATVRAHTPLLLARLTRWDLLHLKLEAPAVLEAVRGLATDRQALAA